MRLYKKLIWKKYLLVLEMPVIVFEIYQDAKSVCLGVMGFFVTFKKNINSKNRIYLKNLNAYETKHYLKVLGLWLVGG